MYNTEQQRPPDQEPQQEEASRPQPFVALPSVPRRRRLPTWWLPATAGVLVLALVATGTWGVVTGRDLGAARQTIAQRNQDLARLQTDLASLKTDLAQEKTRGNDLEATVASLRDRVKNQDACISALATDAATLSNVAAKQGEIHNLTAESSVWAAANSARTAALLAALDDYFNGYSDAWDRLYVSANNWISMGNEQKAEAARQTAFGNAKIDKANRLLDEVDAMLKDYLAGSTLSVCGGPSSGSSA